MDKKHKLGISFLSAFLLIAIGTNPEVLIPWPGWARILLFILLALLQLWNDSVFDLVYEWQQNFQLRERNKQLEKDANESSKQLTELRNVMSSFLEHSDIYRDKVKNKLQINEDYLCIVKSSEGLSKVFENMDEKSQLPFTKVLASFPGSVRPFERMGIFLIPTRSLPNFRGRAVRKYIDRVIIPMVEQERIEFLAGLQPRLRKQAEEFSYKYIAFFVSRGNIAHDVRNRKFNRGFNAFIIGEQIGRGLDNLKQDLSDVIRTRELLQLVNWSAFVDLNKEQEDLLRRYQLKIYEALGLQNLDSLSTLARAQVEQLVSIVWPIVRRAKGTSQKKTRNLCVKIIQGASGTVEVLSANGIQL